MDITAAMLIQKIGGRLTLESGVPISLTDQSAQGTLYFTPYNGNEITLYDGADWQHYTFSELSLSLSGYTASKNYDIWAYDSGGSVALDSTVWTDDTTRATALTTQDAIYVKTGDTGKRYLGTIRIKSASQCEDTRLERFVWNYYNRVDRQMYMKGSGSWSYSTNTWRQANAQSTWEVRFVQGVVEDAVYGELLVTAWVNADGCSIGLGLDANTPHATSGGTCAYYNFAGQSMWQPVSANAVILPSSPGYHELRWLEIVPTGTVTFYGSDKGIMATLRG
jgi:hypothetical protein